MLVAILNGTTAGYPKGGGHLSASLQYMFGFERLGIDWNWIEYFRSSGVPSRDEWLAKVFLTRLRRLGLAERAAVVVFPSRDKTRSWDDGRVIGNKESRIRETLRNADVSFNFCAGLPPFLLEEVSNPVLLDLDPGHLQVSALKWDLGIQCHSKLYSVGSKIAEPDTKIPQLGREWTPYFPPIFLPMWRVQPIKCEMLFSSVTHWGWGGELPYQDQLLSISKRDAYLKYLELPRTAGCKVRLAVHLDPDDTTGDRELLGKNGWIVADPLQCAQNPSAYRRFISESKGEVCCPKPVFRELRTGWFSDRSASYLASGRPVVAEDTGFSDHLPCEKGLLTFSTIEEATDAFARIERDYDLHSRSAGVISEEFFNSDKVLRGLLFDG